MIDSMTKPKVIAVMGPTASGKSALALALAKRCGGEIVSCDSIQVYRGMDIGSAKPSREEQASVPHHLIDILEPEQSFSCADFTALAHDAICDIHRRGKTPVLCGGTGLYMDNLLLDTDFSEAGEDPAYRAELELQPSEILFARLREVDLPSAEATHPNNRKRIIRALEIYHLTGIPKSEWDARSRRKESRYGYLRLLIVCDREKLYARIEERVDEMLRQGLTEEVRSLLPRLGQTARGAIGYKELAAYLRGEDTEENAILRLKQATRNYAKRQITWERRYNPDDDTILRIPMEEVSGGRLPTVLADRVDRFLQSK